MTTLLAMLSEMQSDTERTSTEDVNAMRAKISKAIRAYQPERFYFNESRGKTFNTVAGTAAYDYGDIGGVFYRIDHVFLTQSASTIRELRPVSYRTVERDRLDGNAIPWAWAFMGESIYLTNTPDDVYEVRVTGHEKIAEPGDSDGGNPWMTDAYDLILARAKMEFFAHYLDDNENAIKMLQAERMALAPLRAATSAKTSTGQLMPSQF